VTVERRWCVLVAVWSAMFAAPHLYWAVGGRTGLGTQTAAADAALSQAWFAMYNLAAATLALGGGLAACLVALGRLRRVRRGLRATAGVVGLLLVVRGAAGLTLLGIGLLRGTGDATTPTVLLLIEPWFVGGGIAYAGMARSLRVTEAGDDTMP
jgi:Protein of unknown function (DUF3995)